MSIPLGLRRVPGRGRSNYRQLQNSTNDVEGFTAPFHLLSLAIMAIPALPAPTTTTESAKLVNFSRPNADFTGPFDLLAYVLEKNDPAATRASYYEWTEVATTL